MLMESFRLLIFCFVLISEVALYRLSVLLSGSTALCELSYAVSSPCLKNQKPSMGKVSGPRTTISKEGGSFVGVMEQDAGHCR